MIDVFDLAEHESLNGGERAESAARLHRMCADTGFLVLDGHGVADATIGDIEGALAEFFAQPDEAKGRLAPAPGDPYGWIGVGRESLAQSRGEAAPPDLKETFNGGPLVVPDDAGQDALAFCYRPTPWPDVPGFRQAWSNYYRTMEQLAARLLSAMAEALGLSPDHFDPVLRHPISALRAIRYPPTEGRALDGQHRAGAHSDYGSLTILRPGVAARGLEILCGRVWTEVVAPPGTFVVNLGDLMALWTADRWVSTMHRVAFRPDQPERTSLAFFHQPAWSAEIVPLDQPRPQDPIRSGPYLMKKFRSTGT